MFFLFSVVIFRAWHKHYEVCVTKPTFSFQRNAKHAHTPLCPQLCVYVCLMMRAKLSNALITHLFCLHLRCNFCTYLVVVLLLFSGLQTYYEEHHFRYLFMQNVLKFLHPWYHLSQFLCARCFAVPALSSLHSSHMRPTNSHFTLHNHRCKWDFNFQYVGRMQIFLLRWWIIFKRWFAFKQTTRTHTELVIERERETHTHVQSTEVNVRATLWSNLA